VCPQHVGGGGGRKLPKSRGVAAFLGTRLPGSQKRRRGKFSICEAPFPRSADAPPDRHPTSVKGPTLRLRRMARPLLYGRADVTIPFGCIGLWHRIHTTGAAAHLSIIVGTYCRSQPLYKALCGVLARDGAITPPRELDDPGQPFKRMEHAEVVQRFATMDCIIFEPQQAARGFEHELDLRLWRGLSKPAGASFSRSRVMKEGGNCGGCFA
jgi:hypothetical protein